MVSGIDGFFEGLRGKSVALCGVGVTNTPIARMLLERGVGVTVCDRRAADQLGGLPEEFAALGAKLKLGEDYLTGLQVDVIFRTPGMKFHTPELEEYRRRGIAVTSEMEVFFDICPAKIIAITGSNGKTTTSSVIADILEKAGKRVWLGGNIGKALLPDIYHMAPEDYAVVELSSFQLISMRRSPDVAVVTNLSPNHLDMHKDMQEYIDAKRNIYLHQSAFDRLVVNADCPITSGFAQEARGALMTFSRAKQPYWGAYADENGDILFSDRGEIRRVMNASEIKIPGMHNVENYLAAICAVQGVADDEAILATARSFGGVPHRAQLIRTVDGVSYYNDSIATTPARTITGMLSLFPQKIILIAGGYDKKIPFDGLGEPLCRKVKTLILMGATADKIETVVRSAGEYAASGLNIIRVENMEQAVAIARENAEDGDIVALSPACASFDMYPNFEARGNHFREIVEGM